MFTISFEINMAEVRVIQKCDLTGSIPDGPVLDWSCDGRIAICTDRSILILTSYCSPAEQGYPFPLHKQAIPVPDEVLSFDVCNDQENQMKHFEREDKELMMLDHTISPKTSNSAPYRGYRCAKWSPKNAAEPGRCLLATLTMDHRLNLFQEINNKWTNVSDLSEKLHKIHQRRSVDDEEPILEFIQLKERCYRLAAMEMTWSNMFNISSLSPKESSYECCYLIVAMRSGHIVWWRISPNDPNLVSLAYEWDTGFGLITALYWQQTSQNSGFLIVGTYKGQLVVTPVSLSTSKNSREPTLSLKSSCKLWEEQDRIAVSHIAVLKSSIKKYHIVATKQMFLIACEMALTDSSVIVRHVGHSGGLHKLPATGMCVLDPVMPQSHILLTSTEGKIVKMKVSSIADAIEFQHEELPVEEVDFSRMIIQGVGISPNCVLCAIILKTSVVYDHLVKKDGLQFVMFLTKPFEAIFSELYNILKPPIPFLSLSSSSISKYSDYLECVRVHLSLDSKLPVLFESTLNTSFEDYNRERQTPLNLYYTRFLMRCLVSGMRDSDADCSEIEEKLQIIDSLIMRNHVLQIFSNLQDKIDLITPAQGQSVLIMADWLLQVHNIDTTYVYSAFGLDSPESVVDIPSRETCRICKKSVKFENLKYGTCEQNHKFARCCQSLLLCDKIPYNRCSSCQSIALKDVWNLEPFCTYCCMCLTPVM